MNEFEIIEHHFRRHALGRDDVYLGIGDDAALLHVPAGAHVLGTQVTLAPRDVEPADAFASRLLARALARLVCRCVTPRWATLALTLESEDTAWLQGFATGLASGLARHHVALVGGDTTRGPRGATLALHGHVRALPASIVAAAGDHLLLADAGDPDMLTRLQSSPLRWDSVVCDDGVEAAVGQLAARAGLRVAWQAPPATPLPAGAVLLAISAQAAEQLPGARHIATLAEQAGA